MKFKPKNILYDHDDFKIAWGLWIDTDDKCLGIRWNNYPPNERGGDEAWLVIPEDLSIDFIKSLILKKGADNSEIMKVVNSLK